MTQLGENSVKGTEFKVRISMAPIDNRHMSDIEWGVPCLHGDIGQDPHDKQAGGNQGG